MWIRSQNKLKLVEAKDIGITQVLQGKFLYHIVTCGNDGKNRDLGSYDSLDKAVCVLDLMEPYTSNDKVFYMPSNEDIKI